MEYKRITSCDPNIFPAEIQYLLTFMAWGYSAQHIGIARGHVRGMDGLEIALSDVYKNLLGDDGFKEIILTDASGETLLCPEDQEAFEGEEWLMQMLVAAEIISIVAHSFGEKPKGGA